MFFGSFDKTKPDRKVRAPEKVAFWEREGTVGKTSFADSKVRKKTDSDVVKRIRAYDECLGIRSRRRT